MAFTVEARPRCVYVSWDWDTGSLATIAYYNVYRATSSGGTYSLIGRSFNIRRTGEYTQANSVDPNIILKNYFYDYSGTVGTTYYYKFAPVDYSMNEGSLSTASFGAAPTALPAAAVIPDLPAAQAVPPPRSRLWLWWIFGGSSAVAADHAINFTDRPGTNFQAWVDGELGDAIALYPNINHVIYQPYGKKLLVDMAEQDDVEAAVYVIGTETQAKDGGIDAGATNYTYVTDANTWAEACHYQASNALFDRVLGDFATAIGSVTAAGTHVACFFSSHMLNTSISSDDDILGFGGMRHALAANCSIIIDSAGVIDYKLYPDTGTPIINPTYRAAQLCLARGVPFGIEPSGWRANSQHWINGSLDVFCVSLWSRTLYLRSQAQSYVVKEPEWGGYGHISLLGLLGGTGLETYTAMYETALAELRNGGSVAFQDGSIFFTQFTQAQRDALMAAAFLLDGNSRADRNLRSDRTGRLA